MTSPDPELIVVGRVRKAHGIRGELVVEPTTDAPDAVFASGRRVFAGTADGAPSKGAPELHVARSSPFKGGLIVQFREIATRNDAELWRDRWLLAPADELEPPDENEVYLHDLVGMQVELVSGEVVGVVREVFELPHGHLIDVDRGGGRSALVPLHEVAVREIDADARVVRLDPPAGLLD